MRKIPGIYVEVKGDFSQLSKDVSAAKKIVTEAARGMSDALNNAFSPGQIKANINNLTSSLGVLSRSMALTKENFASVGVGLGDLQKITGTTGAEFINLQQRMLQTQAAKQQEQALRSVASAAGLSRDEIKSMGLQFGLSVAQIEKVTVALHGEETAMKSLSSSSLTLKANASIFSGFQGQSSSFATDMATLANGSRLANASMQTLDAEMKVLRGQTTLTEAEFAKLQGQLLRTQGEKAQEIALKNVASAAGLTVKEMQALGAQMNVSQSVIDKTSASMNNVGKATEFSMQKFKDMIITVGIYTLAFKAITALLDGMKQVVNYNATIEVSQIGMASAFLTAGKYIDATTGKVLEGQAAFKQAQIEAKDVLEQLKAANLGTIATLDQLVRAYQETLPVALRVGFDKSQVQQFTTAMIQAAGAIDASGVLMHQLGEETRSLLTATVNPRTSRIATVLGITNADIRQYKGDAEGLFNFLMEKLAAFRQSGDALQSTWKGVMSNFADVSQQVAGMIGEPLFDTIKIDLKDILDSIVVMDEKTKQLKWSDDFMSGVKTIRDGVDSIIAEFFRLSMLIDKVGGSLTTLGAVLTFGDMDKKFREWNAIFEKRYQENDKKLQALADRRVARDSGGATPPTAKYKATGLPNDTALGNGNSLNAALTAQVSYLKAVEEQKAAIVKASIDLEQQMNDDAYALGLTSYKTYLQTKQNLTEKELTENLKAKQKELADAQAAVGKLSPATDKQGNANPAKDSKNEYEALKRVEDATKAVTEAQSKLDIAREKGATEALVAGKQTLRGYKEIEIQLLEAQGKTIEAAKARAALDNESIDRLKMLAAAREGDADAQRALFAIQQQQAITIKTTELDSLSREKQAQQSIAEINGEYAKSRDLQTELLDIEIKRKQLTGALPGEIALLQKQREEIEKTKTAFGAFDKAFKDITKEWKDTSKLMADMAQTTAQSMQSAFSDFFFDAMEGKLKSLGDYVRSFLSSVNRAIADTLAKSFVSNFMGGPASALGSLGTLFSFGSSGTGAGVAAGDISMPASDPLGGITFAGGYHTGGMFGEGASRPVPSSVFSGARRYHSGLTSDEFPAILKKGEAVFTEGQLRALSAHMVDGPSSFKGFSEDNLRALSAHMVDGLQKNISTGADPGITINVPVDLSSSRSKKLSVELQREIERIVMQTLKRVA